MNPEYRAISDHPSEGETFLFFGKRFPVIPASDRHRILIHQDYPWAALKHRADFELHALECRKIVVSACLCDVHPYRLMKVDKNGAEGYALEIERKIRGNRQKYPRVYSVKPALVSLPPGFDFKEAPGDDMTDLFIMDRDSLLDKTKTLENLLMDLRR